MKILAPFALAIAFLVAIPASSSPQTPTDEQLRRVAERVLASTVKISSVGPEGEGFCTGFVINAGGHVLTAKHCLTDNFSVDGKPSYVIKADEWLAIISSEPGAKPPLPIAKESPKLFERVYAVGNGLDWGIIILERRVAGFYNFEKSHIDLVVNSALVPGMSGGPIYNEKGEVVAINQLSTTGTGVGCGDKALRDFIK